jgi:hypothetical protein
MTTGWVRLALAVALIAGASPRPSAGETLSLKGPDGKVVETRETDPAGRRHGWTVRFEDGRELFRLRFAEGKPVFPRSREEQAKRLEEIDPAEKAAVPERGDLRARREAALRRLRAYRYLVGVPDDVRLDDGLNAKCQSAAELLAKLGSLTHDPPNIGLPEGQYAAAREAAAKSNLHCDFGGRADLAASVDYYIDDSAPHNIGRLGHRRWCLNPSMASTGFGLVGGFAAMWAFDRGRETTAAPAGPDFDLVAYPPAGPVPMSHFGERTAWSISLNPARYRVTDRRPEVTLRRLDDDFAPVGGPVELDTLKLDTRRMGVPLCLIFRPAEGVKAGERYLVSVDGLTTADGKPAPLRYVVEFFSIPGREPYKP